MKHYKKPTLEIVDFDVSDIVMASGCDIDLPGYNPAEQQTQKSDDSDLYNSVV